RPGAAEGTPGTVIVAGADRLRHRHLERLSDACERAGVRLAYLFRHLRDEAELLLGSTTTTVFMRLGNHREAERAANFIGRGHRFVLSRVTRGFGGGETDASGDSKGGSSSQNRTTLPTRVPVRVTTRGTSRTWGTTRSHAE